MTDPSNSGKDNQPKTDDQKPPGLRKRLWIKVRKPLTLFFRLYVVMFVCALLMSFPAIRALGHPLFGPLFSSTVEVQDYRRVYTTEEKPSFYFVAQKFSDYECKFFNADDVYRLGDASTRGYPCRKFQFADIFDRNQQFSGIRPVYTCSGKTLAEDLSSAGALVQLKEPLPPGEYISAFGPRGFRAKGEDIGFSHFFVTNLGAVIKHDANKVIIGALDLRTRKPWSGADVTVLVDESVPRAVGAVVKTDESGLAVVNRPPSVDQKSWDDAIIDAKSGPHVAYFGNFEEFSYGAQTSEFADFNQRFENHNYYQEKFRTNFVTDRPVYRLGQAVNFKGNVRTTGEMGIENPGAGAQLKLEIFDPRNSTIETKELRTDPFGSFTGSLSPSQCASTGDYRVQITYPDSRTEEFTFTFDQYRKPDFKVDVIPERVRYAQGEKVRFKIQANYLFGAPVKNAKVSYSVNSEADLESKTRMKTSTECGEFFNSWEESEGYYRYRYGAGEPFLEGGDVTTDSLGQAFVEFNVPVTKPIANAPWSYCYLDDSLNLSVDITDLSRKTYSSYGSVPVTRGSYTLLVDTKSGAERIGQPLSVDVKTLTYDKKPVPGKNVTLRLSRWEPIEKSPGSYKEIKISSYTAVTDAKGCAVVAIPTDKNLPSDSYVISAESTDDKNRVVGDVTSIWLFGERNSYYFRDNEEQERFQIEFDKVAYKPGDTVKAIVKAPFVKAGDEVYLLATVEGSAVRASKQLTMHGPVAMVDFPVDASHAPNAYIGATIVDKRHKTFFTQGLLKVAPEVNFADISVATDKASYHPGETARYKVTAKSRDGRAIPGMQLNASVVDEGIYVLWQSMRAGFNPPRFGDIFHAIYRKIENEVLTRTTFTELLDLKARLPRPIFDGQGLYVLHLPLLVFFPGTVMCCQETEMRKKDLEAKCAAPSPANSIASSPTAEQAQSAQPSTNARAPAPRVRSNFLDAAAWYPSLVTGPDGTASFSVKLPDDLTTWRATVSGITQGNVIGAGQNTVVSTQDFMARLALPRSYTEFDETVISGIVHNLSPKEQSVALSLSVSPNIKLLDSATCMLNVPKDGVKRQSWRVKVVAPGESTITLKALGSTLSDAEQRKVPVRTFGYRVFLSKNGMIQDVREEKNFPVMLPPDAKLETGSFQLSTSASSIGPVLGNFEKLIEYPYGCTEQTLSRMIPTVIAMRLSKNLGVPLDESTRVKLEKANRMAIPKLLEYQHGDGGWGWWADDSSDSYMTAHVLEGFYLLKQAGVPIDDSVIEQGINYLSSSITTLSADPWDRYRGEDHAKAIYVMSLFKRELDPLTRTWQLINIKKMSPESLAYLTMAFKNVKDEDAAKNTYARLKQLQNQSLEYTNWDHTRELLDKLGVDENEFDYSYRFTGIETTALALRATVKAEPDNKELLDQIARWLIMQRDENGWSNTKTTSCVFLALLEKELADHANRTTDFKARVQAFNKLLRELSFTKTFERGEKVVTVPLRPTPSSILVTKDGPGRLYYTTMLSYDRPLKVGDQPIIKSMPSDLHVKRELYHVVEKKQANQGANDLFELKPLSINSTVKEGDLIMMKINVDAPFSIPYVMVEAALPSGGEVIDEPPNLVADEPSTSTSDHWYWWTHQDILDDRIAFFCTSLPSGKSEFRAFIRMEMPGTFNINPVSMEAMYTNKVHARSMAHSVKVVAAD